MTAATPHLRAASPTRQRRRARGAPIGPDPRGRLRRPRPVRVLARSARSDVAATFSFWITSRAATPLTLSTTVGILWILAGVVAGLTGMAQLDRGARVPVAPNAADRGPALGHRDHGEPARRQGREPDRRARRHASSRRRRSRSAPSPASCPSAAACSTSPSRASSSSAPASRRSRGRIASRAVATRRSASRRRRAAALAAALVGLLLAWLGIRWKVDQIIAGVVINIGAVGITNFLFLRVLTKNTELNTPARRSSRSSIPILSRHPGPRADPVRRDAVPVLHARS